MSHPCPRVAIVHCSGRMKWPPQEQADWLNNLRARGLECEELRPESPSPDGFAAGAAVERAVLLSRALTRRDLPVLWAARGGSGATALVPLLERMLPPVLPPQTMIGFSDVSYLGIWLALRYPELNYIHGPHAYDNLMREDRLGAQAEARLLAFARGEAPEALTVTTDEAQGVEDVPDAWDGIVVPLNLSLAESLAATRQITLPPESVLFLEDVNEHAYALLRKLDSLRNAGWFTRVRAIVLGDFADCKDASEGPLSAAALCRMVATRTGLPTFSLPIFGHGAFRMPITAFAACRFQRKAKRTTITIGSARAWRECPAETPRVTPCERPSGSAMRVHFTGIGGTGMAALAGLIQQAGYSISGSDTPIYPPMDAAIKAMGLDPIVGYKAETLDDVKPDAIVLANVISPRNAKLEANQEFQALLARETTELFSFPSALRHFFLRDSLNLVVSGTHGKTTTVSLLSHVLDAVGHSPSFLVGGTPKNFGAGFRLANRNLFVLEGDEYDSSYFDKGSKFHHYEPGVALLNNMEFDHADIFNSLAQIKDEFSRLLANVARKGGIAVVNHDCPNSLEVAGHHPRLRQLGFLGAAGNAPVHAALEKPQPQAAVPTWRFLSATPHAGGQVLVCLDPTGAEHRIDAKMFGPHNASNIVACLGMLHAHLVLSGALPSLEAPIPREIAAAWARGFASFEGVKRRFELLAFEAGVAVFDDFAHHPTAIAQTLSGFRDYIRSSRSGGRLLACFDPRNATMRRSVLQADLAKSLQAADLVYLGQVMQDLRLKPGEAMDGEKVARDCGPQARYFMDNAEMLETLFKETREGDTVVFMSAGSFDGLPHRFAERVRSRKG